VCGPAWFRFWPSKDAARPAKIQGKQFESL